MDDSPYTPTDYEKRQQALHQAVIFCNGQPTVQDPVNIAEKFYAFLASPAEPVAA